MLRSLRKRLTLLCVVITGIILSGTAAALLILSESQIDSQSRVTFQNNLNSVIYKIQSGNILDIAWLSQLETGNRLIVYIQDNGVPILYPGSWTPKTPRAELAAAAQKEALEQYGLDPSAKPYSVIDISSASFSVTGGSGDRYQAAVAVIPGSHGNWQSVTLLRDTSADQRQKMIMRYSFLGLIVSALGLLFVFSWWFAGRSIRPIEQSQKKQTEFVAAASHELRSPLAVIRASLSAVAGGAEDSPRFLETADRECLRMARLIDDLLFLASADAGSWSVRTEQIDADNLMMALYENYESIALQHGAALSLKLPEESSGQISGDRLRLLQALSALADNAFSYTPEGGRVLFLAQKQRGALLLSVSDSGPGIPDDQKEKIFDRFYRADLSRSKKEHYGLGLSVAREIAELHGGSLSVSDGPEGGACFTLRLPCSDDPGVKNAPAQ